MPTLSLYANDLIGVLIVYQGLFFGLSLLFSQKRQNRFNLMLACFMLSLSGNFLNMFLLNQGWTHLNFGAFFGLSYGPLCLLYTRSLIYADKQIAKKETWHFLPAFIVLASLAIFSKDFSPLTDTLPFTVGVIFQLSLYLIRAYREVSWYRSTLKNVSSEFISVNLSWLQYLILSLAIVFAIVMIEAVVVENEVLDNAVVIVIYAYVLFFVNSIYWKGLRHPQIFSGLSGEAKSINKEIASRYSHSNLKEEQASEYLGQLEAYMAENKPYLVYNITIEELSEQTDISARHLSQVINQLMDKNFYDFINGYRVEEAKMLLTDKSKDLRINEVMYDSGFSSKSTFNAVFRKATGQTPSEYRKNQG
ncbi:MAG: AraC family transcriptional regulator [Roseivirga sp.]|nr:AraC family transcriptional regulator [Roseivirga sp.]